MENKITPKEALIRLHNQATRYFKPNDEKDQMVNKRFGQYKSIIEQALTELEETKQINEIFKNAITIKHTGIRCETKLDHSKDDLNYSVKHICEVFQNNIEEELKKQLREWVLKNAFPEELKALEVIKNKKVQVAYLHSMWDDFETTFNNNDEDVMWLYNEGREKGEQLIKEEYDLLKEVLL